MLTSLKKTFRFPFACAGFAGTPLSGSSFAGVSNDGIRDLFAGTTWLTPDNQQPRIDLACQTIVFNRSVGGLPLTGISLAADSPISDCDIWLADTTSDVRRIRVSNGNPFIGDVSEQSNLFVSLPYCPPAPPVAVNTNLWDGSAVQDATSGKVFSSPLRLEFWYGDEPPPIRQTPRPIYSARARINFIAPNNGSLYVVTQGRSRVQATVVTADALTTLAIQGVVTQADIPPGNFVDLIQTKQISAAAAAGNPVTNTNVVNTSPHYSMMRFDIASTTVGGITATLDVFCWD